MRHTSPCQSNRPERSLTAIRYLPPAKWAELMPYRMWMAAVLVIACGLGRAAGGDVQAVTPSASGLLTKCRGWLVATSCKTYQHISLPPRIAVGDTIALRFGSNPKDYAFPVARSERRPKPPLFCRSRLGQFEGVPGRGGGDRLGFTVHTPGDAIQSTHNSTMPIDSAMLVAPRPKRCGSAEAALAGSPGAMGLRQTPSSAMARRPRPSV